MAFNRLDKNVDVPFEKPSLMEYANKKTTGEEKEMESSLNERTNHFPIKVHLLSILVAVK